MAEPAIKGGLGVADPSKVNFYGAQEGDLSEYQQSLQDSIRALQMRYEQPNWFNVAAGFFKPQLGGFAASLGSASEAMGQNLERQREAQLPIAQMRSQLAMSKIAMGQNKSVADMEAARIRDKLPITPEYAAKVINIAPDSPQAKAIQAQLTTQQKERELASGEQSTRAAQYAQTLTAINSKWLAGGFKTKADYAAALDAAQQTYGPGAGYKLPGANAEAESGAPLPVPKPKLGEVAAPVVGDVAPPPPAAATDIPPPVVDKTAIAPAAADKTAKTPQIRLLDNGARVNDDAFALAQAGIPIISNVRTQDEQDALKHHQVDGKWFTAQGLPVGNISKHLTGDAIDVASGGKTLTEDQKKLLAANGWKQNVPNDPGHWERAPAPAAAKTPEKIVLNSVYATVQYDPESDAKAVDEREKQARAELAQLGTIGAPNPNKAAVANATNMIDFVKKNKTLHNESTGLLQNKDPGLWSEIKAQVQTAIDKGLTLAVGNPILSSMSVALPVQKMKEAGLNPKQREYLQNFANLAARVGVDQQRMFAINPNAISNKEANLFGALNANTDTTANNVITLGLHHAEDLRALGDQWNFVNDVDQGRHPYVSIGKAPDRLYTIMRSKPYGEIYDPYIKKHAQINEALQEAINRKR